MEKNPEIQFRSPEEIKCYQEERLTQTLTYLQAHSKFYQRMFEEHHIDINQIKKIEDLQQIPVTTKTDLQLHNDDFISEVSSYTKVNSFSFSVFCVYAMLGNSISKNDQ